MFLPFKLKPVFKDYLWGGTKLRDDFGKSSELEKIAESWELSCHSDGVSFIDNSFGQEQTLPRLIEKYGTELIGSNCEKFDRFPVLIKLIDAKDNLSLQVHPDDKYASEHENEYGKTEMWYVVDCEEGASLIYGFKQEITKNEFTARIKNNTLLDAVKIVPVKKGDVFFINSGTLHAIGKNILIAEIQQNSNTTYRVYDYGRKDKNGVCRELHTEKACDVTDLSPSAPCPSYPEKKHDGFSSRLLSSCEYFSTTLISIYEKAELFSDKASFEHLLVIEGSGLITGPSLKMPFKKGDSIFIPAGYGSFTVSGSCLIIKTRID
ncbi:MAG: class I mannose-6-phosphate isomerase [Ruminococcus sp.]|nr:class I mannose-6-phosphate isomerase [Ruminococcus sp.]